MFPEGVSECWADTTFHVRTVAGHADLLIESLAALDQMEGRRKQSPEWRVEWWSGVVSRCISVLLFDEFDTLENSSPFGSSELDSLFGFGVSDGDGEGGYF